MEKDLKAYLKNVRDLGPGIPPDNRILAYKPPDGNEIWGFFDPDYYKDGKLEVAIIDVSEDRRKIQVLPRGGEFGASTCVFVSPEELESIA